MSRHSISLLIFAVLTGSLLSISSLNAQVTSSDSNFTPTVLKSGLPGLDGVVFRHPTGDVLVTQTGGQISAVDAISGAISSFATQTRPDTISVRTSDGLVAVTTNPFGPIDFYTSTGAAQGTPIPGSAIPVTPVTGADTVCITGVAFDTGGNLFVAAGPGSTTSNGCLPSTAWGIWEFAGPTPWTSTAAFVTNFGASNVVIQDIAYSAAKPPAGTLYAIDSNNDTVYEISLTPVGEFGIVASFLSDVPANNPRGIAVDPLLGDVYVADFDGTNVYRIPAPGFEGESSASVFASGFTNGTSRLGFDTVGNLYINENNGESSSGTVWKFARASAATPLQAVFPGQTNLLRFTNPNPGMSDQMQSILVPPSANLGGTAFIQDIFVSVSPATLNSTMVGGTTGDVGFFGGAPVPPGTTCAPVQSAGNNCAVVVQKCYDANLNPFAICPVQEPSASTDRIQLTFTFAGPQPTNSAFLIGFDDGDGNEITDITVSDCCGGGTKSLCSKTFAASLLASDVDFTITASPSILDLTASNPASATVTLTSLNSFAASTISLGVSDVPPGLSATLTPTSVSLSSGGTASSSLSVGLSSNTTIGGIATTIGNLLAIGCIDNAGIANALASKASAAQTAVSGGLVPTAINTLGALSDQIRAQTGKHIAASCSTTTTFPMLVTATPFAGELRSTGVNITFAPATVLNNEVQTIVTSLKASVSTEDPITGFVVNASGVGLPGATLSLFNSLNAVIATATTDVTGFYYFPTTGTLSLGSTYAIQVTGFPAGFSSATSNPPFTWGGKGLAYTFTAQ